jgi:TPP-dependent pyruvate/acetoin dehydrogenase alpha subunit
MPAELQTKAAKFDVSKYQGLDQAALLRIYRTMYLSRKLDDREIQLRGQKRLTSRLAVLVMKPSS